jgi:hypothetical protein
VNSDVLLYTLLAFVFALAINFLPTIIAVSRRHQRRLVIFVCNLAMLGIKLVEFAVHADGTTTMTVLWLSIAHTVAWLALMVWACWRGASSVAVAGEAVS